MIIRDAANGIGATVSSGGQLLTQCESHDIEHHYAYEHEDVYRVIGDFASINNNTFNILHLKNDSTSKKFCVSHVKVQALDLAGGTAVPAVETYFRVVKGMTYSSGGSSVTPVNTNLGSGKTADMTAYDNNATLTGTAVELERWYVTSDGLSYWFEFHGHLIIPQNATLTVQCISDHTSGVALATAVGVYR